MRRLILQQPEYYTMTVTSILIYIKFTQCSHTTGHQSAEIKQYLGEGDPLGVCFAVSSIWRSV